MIKYILNKKLTKILYNLSYQYFPKSFFLSREPSLLNEYYTIYYIILLLPHDLFSILGTLLSKLNFINFITFRAETVFLLHSNSADSFPLLFMEQEQTVLAPFSCYFHPLPLLPRPCTYGVFSAMCPFRLVVPIVLSVLWTYQMYLVPTGNCVDAAYSYVPLTRLSTPLSISLPP